ncbi:hypothetical protein DESME_04780 [Desulfitobacterium metallireducens DSM 15288]|uniref:Uncharacterized protein n=1 Tax=Desulfitobacterium metallireducens DSM 15288 TaxID=871968 RepID=W0EC80_9FIRM|nr:hypothetical protein DESME_04780 [Desulfitobacterium metallireducens DSM 15288]
MEELSDFLIAQESDLAKFYDMLFRRFVEKVKIQSMAEVEFVKEEVLVAIKHNDGNISLIKYDVSNVFL